MQVFVSRVDLAQLVCFALCWFSLRTLQAYMHIIGVAGVALLLDCIWIPCKPAWSKVGVLIAGAHTEWLSDGMHGVRGARICPRGVGRQIWG